MSVVVRMEMPKNNCEMAVEIKGAGDWCPIAARVCDYYSTKKMPDWCPIICSLPEGHGRLVDADAMARDLEYDCELDAKGLDDMTIVGHEREHLQFDKDCKQNCIWYLTEQETIVPAERSEHETD